MVTTVTRADRYKINWIFERQGDLSENKAKNVSLMEQVAGAEDSAGSFVHGVEQQAPPSVVVFGLSSDQHHRMHLCYVAINTMLDLSGNTTRNVLYIQLKMFGRISD